MTATAHVLTEEVRAGALAAGVRCLPVGPVVESENGNSAFTGERLELRNKTLGASEIGAVAGLSARYNALDIYLRKVGMEPPFEGNEYTEWGNRLEPLIGEKYSQTLCAVLERSPTLVRLSEPWMCATPDFIASEFGAPEETKEYWGLECKNKDAHIAHQFGETGTDQVPHDIAAQGYWGMMVTGLLQWDFAVLIGGNQFRWFRIYHDDAIEADLQQIGYDFMHDHVYKGIEPPVDGSESWRKHLQTKFAKHGELIIEATEEQALWIRDLNGIRAQVKALEPEESRLENLIKNAIGENAGITSPFGGFTWKAPKQGNPSWKEIALELGAEDFPDIIERHRGSASRKFLAKGAK